MPRADAGISPEEARAINELTDRLLRECLTIDLAAVLPSDAELAAMMPTDAELAAAMPSAADLAALSAMPMPDAVVSSETPPGGGVEIDPTEEGRCGATLRRRGGRCRRWPVSGRTRCRLHGGAPGSGGQPDNENGRRHGFYSRKMSAEELRAFNAMDGSIALRLARIRRRRIEKYVADLPPDVEPIAGFYVAQVEVTRVMPDGEVVRTCSKFPDPLQHLARVDRRIARLVAMEAKAKVDRGR